MIIQARYEIQDELGAGGMGTVFRGLDKQTGETVAIKQLKPEMIEADIIERFQREGEALRELNHPNMVKLLNTVEEKGDHYLILEYVSGGDLKRLLAKGKMPIEQILTIAIQIADALTRAHFLNIIHRDLKPANILIAEDGIPLLTDFGVAHMADKDSVTDTNAIIGTIDYLAPEVFGKNEVDKRIDIWAFGIMLFEMLTGQIPFKQKTIVMKIMAITTEPTPDLEELRPDAPLALIDLIYRMLEKDPQARIASVRHVGAALEDIMQGRNKLFSESRFKTPIPESFHRPKHNLPAQTTEFVGREHELAELSKLINTAQNRLFTILAPGGMGKSRLALEIASRYVADTNANFPNGVYFVELAPLSSIDSIPTAIAAATGYTFQQDGREQKQQVLDFLGNKTILLVLDNYEHLLNGVSLVTEILKAAPDVTVVVTSRQRLSQPGETIFHLSGMDFPEWETPEDALEYAAVKLFMNSARRARPDFELAEDNLDYVARICRLVQGMPLGIVLAAAWLNTLSVEEVASELEQSMDILEDDAGQVPERQQSIRAVMDYSWQTMSETEQAIFMKMSVFRGGMSRNAAQTVTEASLRQLMALVNKSLLHRDNVTGRYHIHELLRQYAEEQLEQFGAVEETHNAHLHYYANAMQQREADLKGSKQVEAINDIEGDFENVKAAWKWAVKQENIFEIDKMAESFTWFCIMANYLENGTELLQAAENLFDSSDEAELPIEWARLMYLKTAIGSNTETITMSYDTAKIMLQIARDKDSKYDIAQATAWLGFITMRMGDWAQAQTLALDALNLFREIGDHFSQLAILIFNAYLCSRGGGENLAREYLMEAMNIGLQMGEKYRTGTAIANLGLSESISGNRETAKSYYLKALGFQRQFKNIRATMYTLNNLTVMYRERGETEQALIHALDAVHLATEMNVRGSIIFALRTLGDVYLHQKRYTKAMEQFEESVSLLDPSDNLDFIDFMKLWYIFGLFGVGEMNTAIQMLKIILPTVAQHSQIFQVSETVFAVSLMLAYQENQPERALELASLVAGHPAFGLWEHNPLARELDSYLKEALAPDVYEAAWERGKSLDLMTVVKELADEFGIDA